MIAMHLGMHHDIYVYSGYIKYVLRFIIPRKMKLIFVYQQEIEKKTSKEKQHSQIYSPQKIKGKKFLAYSNQRHLRTFLKT